VVFPGAFLRPAKNFWVKCVLQPKVRLKQPRGPDYGAIFPKNVVPDFATFSFF